jgi:ubiquinone/menaquinone biosynthesis C-methylase UbiE
MSQETLIKYNHELAFWRGRFANDKGTFQNSHFENLFLSMAQENSAEFTKGKVIADFGCGPRGSLVWAKEAAVRIGIDVLADYYIDLFSADIKKHGMLYLKSTENNIPMPSNFVDVMFTLNAIDHVDNFQQMCNEIYRVMKVGAEFIGSFNLEEPASSTEPQKLTEEKIKSNLLNKLTIKSYRTSKRHHGDNPYVYMLDNDFSYTKGQEGFLWVRAVKEK